MVLQLILLSEGKNPFFTAFSFSFKDLCYWLYNSVMLMVIPNFNTTSPFEHAAKQLKLSLSS